MGPINYAITGHYPVQYISIRPLPGIEPIYSLGSLGCLGAGRICRRISTCLTSRATHMHHGGEPFFGRCFLCAPCDALRGVLSCLRSIPLLSFCSPSPKLSCMARRLRSILPRTLSTLSPQWRPTFSLVSSDIPPIRLSYPPGGFGFDVAALGLMWRPFNLNSDLKKTARSRLGSTEPHQNFRINVTLIYTTLVT